MARGNGLVIQVTIDAGSKREADLIAASMPGQPRVTAWRGYGIVRLWVAKSEAADLVPILAECVGRHNVGWARIRFGEDEWMFRGRKASAS